mgnify:CR=1 FL=1
MKREAFYGKNFLIHLYVDFLDDSIKKNEFFLIAGDVPKRWYITGL